MQSFKMIFLGGYDFTGGRISHFPIDFGMDFTTVKRDCAACDYWALPGAVKARDAGQFCTSVIKAPNLAHIQPNMLQTFLESHRWFASTPHWPTNSEISYYERLFSLTSRINLGVSATKIRSRIENDRKKFQFFD